MKSIKPTLTKWKSIVALILAAIALIKGWLFFWGILCLFWGITNILAQEAYFVERILRAENPIIYWIIIAFWLILSAFYFAIDPNVNRWLSDVLFF